MTEPRPDRIGRYQIEGTIGAGGMGSVYRARHIHMQREVALKLVHPELAGDDRARARFLREARIASRLRHPCVVELFDYDEVDGACYLAMEIVDGEPFEEVLKREISLAPDRAYTLFDQLLHALDAAHEVGVIHRDLKPSNMMVGAGDALKVLDFGIAHTQAGTSDTAGLTTPGQILGTPAYGAPEQLIGLGIDHRADLYTAGIILFEVLAGRRPFESETLIGYINLHLHEPPPHLHHLRPDLAAGPALDRVLQRALAKEPESRFASARAFRTALRNALDMPPDDAWVLRVGSGALEVQGTAASTRTRPVPPPPAARPGAEPFVAEPSVATPSMIAEVALADHDTLNPGARRQLFAEQATVLACAGSEAATRLPRARLALLVEGAPRVKRIFLFGGRELACGRGEKDKAGKPNDVVLRVLPCRTQKLDPTNWSQTLRLSQTHFRLAVDGGSVHITDSSSGGTTIDGARIARGQATLLPDRARLRLSNALDLDVTVLRGVGGGASAPVRAVLLARSTNASEQVYVLVVERLTLGGLGADLTLWDDDAGLAVELGADGLAVASPGPATAPRALAIAGRPGAVLESTPLQPDQILHVAGALLRVVEPTPTLFVTSAT